MEYEKKKRRKKKKKKRKLTNRLISPEPPAVGLGLVSKLKIKKIKKWTKCPRP
jgi:hypothetical protein